MSHLIGLTTGAHPRTSSTVPAAVGCSAWSGAISNSLRHEDIWFTEPVRVREDTDDHETNLAIELERVAPHALNLRCGGQRVRIEINTAEAGAVVLIVRTKVNG